MLVLHQMNTQTIRYDRASCFIITARGLLICLLLFFVCVLLSSIQVVTSVVNHSLADPLNEAFPLIDQREDSEPSLQDLVLGTDADKTEEVSMV